MTDTRGFEPTQEPGVRRVVRPVPANVRDVWPREDGHFTPWLAENLDWLSEAVDLDPLELVGTEVRLPHTARSLDILARTPAGAKVAIENQYLKTDHDHLTRGMAYAVGHEAQALIVISEGHLPEFVAIANYLNDAFEHMPPSKGIAVFLVELQVERVVEHYVPRFSVVARPNEWIAEVQRELDSGAPSVEAFLAGVTEDFRPRAEKIVRAWQARPGAGFRVNPEARSLTLDYPYDRVGSKKSVYVLYANDSISVNRGYFLESVVKADAEEEMDRELRAAFPQLNSKPYYPSVVGVDPSAVAQFADWLIAHGESS